MKVIDCFPFFDEFLILDVRFKELYDVVDKFIVVESAETFTGIPKPFLLSECLHERYPQYADKVEIIQVSEKFYEDQWDREFYQKNHICKENISHLNLDDNDIVLFSDADEIPKRSFILSLIENNVFELRAGIGGKTYYYKFNAVTTEVSHRPRFSSYKHFTNFFDGRLDESVYVYPDSGWHFSFIKKPEDIRKKIEAFSHQEFNQEHITDVSNIKQKINNLSDLFSRPSFHISTEQIDDSFPEYIKENLEQLKEWIA